MAAGMAAWIRCLPSSRTDISRRGLRRLPAGSLLPVGQAEHRAESTFGAVEQAQAATMAKHHRVRHQ